MGELQGCQCQVAKDYTKLTNVAEFLIQAASAQDLSTWVEKLNQHSVATPNIINNNNQQFSSDGVSNYSQSYNDASESRDQSRSKNSKGGGFFRGSSSKK